MTDHVVLVGMMGAGKTSVGRILADRLGRPFADSDAEVEAATGRTVTEIFSSDGEDAFRVHERAALRAVLERHEPLVVAAAGGAVLDETNRRAITRAGPVVWLRGSVEVLARRAAADDPRPLLDGRPAATLERLSAEREDLYREVADHVVEVDDTGPDGVAERILAAIA